MCSYKWYWGRIYIHYAGSSFTFSQVFHGECQVYGHGKGDWQGHSQVSGQVHFQSHDHGQGLVQCQGHWSKIRAYFRPKLVKIKVTVQVKANKICFMFYYVFICKVAMKVTY